MRGELYHERIALVAVLGVVGLHPLNFQSSEINQPPPFRRQQHRVVLYPQLVKINEFGQPQPNPLGVDRPSHCERAHPELGVQSKSVGGNVAVKPEHVVAKQSRIFYVKPLELRTNGIFTKEHLCWQSVELDGARYDFELRAQNVLQRAHF